MTDKDYSATLKVYNRTVTQSQIFTTVWNAFISIIKTYPNPKTDSSKWYYSSYPFKNNETKTDFPLLIIGEVDINNYELQNYDKIRYTLTLSFYVNDTSSEKCDILCDGLFDHFLDNKSTLYTYGIRNPILIRTNKDHFDIGSFVVHERRMDISFDFWVSGIHGI